MTKPADTPSQHMCNNQGSQVPRNTSPGGMLCTLVAGSSPQEGDRTCRQDIASILVGNADALCCLHTNCTQHIACFPDPRCTALGRIGCNHQTLVCLRAGYHMCFVDKRCIPHSRGRGLRRLRLCCWELFSLGQLWWGSQNRHSHDMHYFQARCCICHQHSLYSPVVTRCPQVWRQRCSSGSGSTPHSTSHRCQLHRSCSRSYPGHWNTFPRHSTDTRLL